MMDSTQWRRTSTITRTVSTSSGGRGGRGGRGRRGRTVATQLINLDDIILMATSWFTVNINWYPYHTEKLMGFLLLHPADCQILFSAPHQQSSPQADCPLGKNKTAIYSVLVKSVFKDDADRLFNCIYGVFWKVLQLCGQPYCKVCTFSYVVQVTDSIIQFQGKISLLTWST